jgi:hypothetical protein
MQLLIPIVATDKTKHALPMPLETDSSTIPPLRVKRLSSGYIAQETQ